MNCNERKEDLCSRQKACRWRKGLAISCKALPRKITKKNYIDPKAINIHLSRILIGGRDFMSFDCCCDGVSPSFAIFFFAARGGSPTQIFIQLDHG